MGNRLASCLYCQHGYIHRSALLHRGFPFLSPEPHFLFREIRIERLPLRWRAHHMFNDLSFLKAPSHTIQGTTMPSATESTEWPSTPIASEVKQLISLFFHLVDQPDANIGDRLASEVFTTDGKLLTVQGAAVGSEGQVKSIAARPHFRYL